MAQALGPPGADLWPGNPGKGSGNLGLIWARPKLVLDDDWIRSSHSRCGQQDGAQTNDGGRALKASLHRSLCFACGGCCESDLECKNASSQNGKQHLIQRTFRYRYSCQTNRRSAAPLELLSNVSKWHLKPSDDRDKSSRG